MGQLSKIFKQVADEQGVNNIDKAAFLLKHGVSNSYFYILRKRYLEKKSSELSNDVSNGFVKIQLDSLKSQSNAQSPVRSLVIQTSYGARIEIPL